MTEVSEEDIRGLLLGTESSNREGIPRSVFDSRKHRKFSYPIFNGSDPIINKSKADALNSMFVNGGLEQAKDDHLFQKRQGNYIRSYKTSQYYDEDEDGEEVEIEAPPDYNEEVYEHQGTINEKVGELELSAHDNDYVDDTTFIQDDEQKGVTTSKSLLLKFILSITLLALFTGLFITIYSNQQHYRITNTENYSSGRLVDMIPGLNKRMNNVEDTLEELKKNQSNLRANQNEIIDKLQLFSSDLELKITKIEDQFKGYQVGFEKNVAEVASIRSDYNNFNDQLLKVYKEFESFKKNGHETVQQTDDYDSTSTSEYFSLLNKIKELEDIMIHFKYKLGEFEAFKVSIEESLNTTESKILNVLESNLLNYIPVWFENDDPKEVKVAPEFSDYISYTLKNLLSSEDRSNRPDLPISWDSFVAENKVNLENFISKQGLISTDKFNKIVNSIKFEFNKELVSLKEEILKQGVSKPGQKDIDLSFLSSIIKQSIEAELNSRSFSSRKPTKKEPEPLLEELIEYNHADLRKGARVIKSLTKPVKLPRLREKFVDRVKYGWLDFINRSVLGKKRTLPGLFNIDLLSSSNSPNNLLVDDSELHWQGLNKDLPIHIGVKLDKPIYLDEIFMILPSEVMSRSSLLHSLPRTISVLADLHGEKNLKSKISKLISLQPNGKFSLFTKISTWDIPLVPGRSIIQIKLLNEVRDLLKHTKIQDLVFVIESNHGDENFVILNQIKVYGSSKYIEVKDIGSDNF